MKLVVEGPELGIFAAIFLVFFLFSFWFIYNYQRKYEKSLLVTVVTGLSMMNTLVTICLYPMDLTLVSSHTFFPRFFWITIPLIDLTVNRLKILYYLFYGLHLIDLFFVLPFTYYFYSKWDENSTTRTRLFGAFKRSLYFVFLFLILFSIGFFITTTQIKSLSSGIDQFRKILTTEYIKKIMFFIVGVLLLFSMVFFCTYTAFGFSLLPLWIIKTSPKNIPTLASDLKHALILNREKQRTIEVRCMGFHAQMSTKDRRVLQSLQREEKTLVRRVRLAKEGKKKWIQSIYPILHVFQLVMATFLIFYLYAASVMGIFNMRKTINIDFLKFNSYNRRNTLSHALLISTAILILITFSFNYTLSEIIIPRYSQFGSQTYCNYTVSNSQNIYDCINHPEYIFRCSETKNHFTTKFYVWKLSNTINNVIFYLKKESESLKMGRSNPSLLHNIEVSVSKGKKAFLKDLAHVSIKNNRSMIMTIYDSDNVKYLISAVRSLSYGFNPVVHPSNPLQYVIPLPPPTKESQKKLLEQISELKENTGIAIRNIRTMNMKRLKKAKQSGELTEDETRSKEKNIAKIINQANQEIEKIIENTKKSILENKMTINVHSL
ncbi:hypothetical protein PMAC_002446 [Pneumocystis sp. 'macacae']|nr:hypothetical protein PMAC_002446 [Pneumocystis sp. 'macacae']